MHIADFKTVLQQKKQTTQIRKKPIKKKDASLFGLQKKSMTLLFKHVKSTLIKSY